MHTMMSFYKINDANYCCWFLQHAQLLEKLQAVKASQEELDMLTSTAEVHSQRFKKRLKLFIIRFLCISIAVLL